MKFSPYIRPAAVLVLAVTLGACSTPANRRQLYNSTEADSGVWHDYTRRRQAELETGVNAGTAASALPGRGPATAQPPSGPSGTPGPLPPGTSLQAPLSPAEPAPSANVPPPAPAEAPLPATPTDAGATTTTPPADGALTPGQ